MHFGGLLEIISLRIDGTGTKSSVALACFTLAPFPALLLFSHLTDRVQQERSPSQQQNFCSCLKVLLELPLLALTLFVYNCIYYNWTKPSGAVFFLSMPQLPSGSLCLCSSLFLEYPRAIGFPLVSLSNLIISAFSNINVLTKCPGATLLCY